MTTTATMPGAPELAPLLIGIDRVVQLCGISERTCWRLAASGGMPAPLKFCSRRLWRVTELEEWVKGGCQAIGGASK